MHENGFLCNTHNHYNQLANTSANTAYSLLLSAEACALPFTWFNMHATISLRVRLLQIVHILSHVSWSNFNLPQ